MLMALFLLSPPPTNLPPPLLPHTHETFLQADTCPGAFELPFGNSKQNFSCPSSLKPPWLSSLFLLNPVHFVCHLPQPPTGKLYIYCSLLFSYGMVLGIQFLNKYSLVKANGSDSSGLGGMERNQSQSGERFGGWGLAKEGGASQGGLGASIQTERRACAEVLRGQTLVYLKNWKQARQLMY